MNTPHPIPYQGSKRRLARHLLNYLPLQAQRLVEPFAGSGAFSLLAAGSRPQLHFWLNDLNPALMSLWKAILYEPERLSRFYRRLWMAQVGRERQFYEAVRTRFNQTQAPYYFLYLLARCVKASVRYNRQGEFNQSPDHRRKGRHPDTMQKDLQIASALLAGRSYLSQGDYRTVLEQVTPADVVYLDPPYQGVSGGGDTRYLAGLTTQELLSSLESLNQRAIPYLLSYDGRTGQKSFGGSLPAYLGLTRLELKAGPSSQATLLGRRELTVETLYLSPHLSAHLTPLADYQQATLFW
jgi:DNA adenine methylase